MNITTVAVVAIFCAVSSLASHTNFLVKHFQLCDNDNPLKFHGNITTEHNRQYLDFNITFPCPIDDNIGMTCFIQHSLDGKTLLPLFTIREKHLCQAFNKYLGEPWYVIERAAQVPAGVCPLLAGRYHGQHVPLEFSRMHLQTFPYGFLRFTVKWIRNTDKKIMLCWISDVENTEE